jgi:hypothetical protein
MWAQSRRERMVAGGEISQISSEPPELIHGLSGK